MAALALYTCATGARPLLLPPQNLVMPPPAGQHYEEQFPHRYYSVAIDSGTLLVSAQRSINAQNDRVDGVYIFERNADGRWAYAEIFPNNPNGQST